MGQVQPLHQNNPHRVLDILTSVAPSLVTILFTSEGKIMTAPLASQPVQLV